MEPDEPEPLQLHPGEDGGTKEKDPDQDPSKSPRGDNCFCCNKVLTKQEVDTCKKDHLKLMCEEEWTVDGWIMDAA